VIEQSIYFALGCIVTALLALCFAPLFWRRALRLTRHRLQLQVPLSMQEILAERDQLRAAFAVERVRLEQAMMRVDATKTQDMAEIGRKTVEASTMTDTIAGLRRLEAAQQNEIDLLLREQAEGGAETGALKIALDDAHGLVANLKRQAEQAGEHRRRHQSDADVHRTTVAALETRAMGLEMQLLDAKRAAGPDGHGGLKSKLESAMAQAARHEAASLSLRRELDEAKARLRALDDEAREREKSLQLERSMRTGRGAVRLAETAGHEIADDAASGSAIDQDSGLRDSIHALGLAVATMTREARRAAEDPDAAAATSRVERRAEVP
jgi:hypothetical protein